MLFFFFSSRRRHTRFSRDWSSDVCSSDLIDRYMPDLTGSPRQAGIHPSILHNARANTSPHKDADKIVVALARAIEPFTQRGHLDIIANRGKHIKSFAEDAAQRHIVHTQVRRIQYDPRLPVNLPGSTDADRDQRAVRRQISSLQRSRSQLNRALRDKILAPLSTGTLAGRSDHLARSDIDDGGQGLRPPQIDD